VSDTAANPMKPLGIKSYGSIGHLPQSRLGPGDHKVTDGQARICLEKARDRHDTIIVQEKLDGSNVGVALKNGEIIPLIRAGFRARDSHYPQHHRFHEWAMANEWCFRSVLDEGWRICGEAMFVAHGTIYAGLVAPFFAFDIFNEKNERRQMGSVVCECTRAGIETPKTLSVGAPLPLDAALELLGERGHQGAQEPAEGVVYRVERQGKVDFLAKYVRPGKVDGKYLGGPEISMWPPETGREP
jgi:hypothetical protein